MAYRVNSYSLGVDQREGPRMVLHAARETGVVQQTACGAEPGTQWYWFKFAECIDEWYAGEADRSIPFVACRTTACTRLLDDLGLPKVVAAGAGEENTT